MSHRGRARELQGSQDRQSSGHDLPPEVALAQGMDWDVHIDAYLCDAARLGERYVALVYSDRSGKSSNGMTVATPPVRCVDVREGFKLMRSDGGDHYVITSEQAV
ncbi:hypothetical protein U8291_13685 [Pseudomonas sp. A2]|uniref:hypothetical protein n=1 Tax=Pseudomonas sp. A2 TaxID=107445 RepID=UPI002C0B0C0F|nr:hypothetical protein [Pseudomonas sp. A2]MEB3438066.1 hypothetical protein [Pseudomonas sp. A2]